jgi:3'-phosphoadenosine 5'-phosphosulfate (PAPS) 3'-phosphatase
MLLSAAKGKGAWWHPLVGGESTRAEVSQAALAPHEPVRVVAPARATPTQIAARLAVGRSTGHPCELVHSDSQAKYGHVIAGLADVAYSRRGGGPGKYIWDHAGAILLAREAGAWVGDTDGSDIDCSLGRRLGGNDAVICAARGLGPAIASELTARDRAEGFGRHARADT